MIRPALLEMPGVDREARWRRSTRRPPDFYGRAPWSKLGYEAAIRIATDRYPSGPWYAVIMGQSGLTFGLALYDDLELLQEALGRRDERRTKTRAKPWRLHDGRSAEAAEVDRRRPWMPSRSSTSRSPARERIPRSSARNAGSRCARRSPGRST